MKTQWAQPESKPNYLLFLFLTLRISVPFQLSHRVVDDSLSDEKRRAFDFKYKEDLNIPFYGSYVFVF